VHYHKRGKRAAVCAWFLREQDVLRYITPTDWDGCSAFGENDFRPTEHRHNLD
jgi:hypothetical protein